MADRPSTDTRYVLPDTQLAIISRPLLDNDKDTIALSSCVCEREKECEQGALADMAKTVSNDTCAYVVNKRQTATTARTHNTQ